MYSIQALWSAADLKLPMTIVIVNNGGYAALSEFSSHFNIKQLVGTKLPGIDFVGTGAVAWAARRCVSSGRRISATKLTRRTSVAGADISLTCGGL